MAASSVHELRLSFEARGAKGLVTVTVRPNTDPSSVGADPAAVGLPVCEATVATDLAGYDSLFGWVQLVGTDSTSAAGRQFEPDPLQIFDDLDLPFGFYGIRPTLFDAPSRHDRQQRLGWLAHSFPCVSPRAPMDRTVQPVAAFQWGFRLMSGDIDIVPPSELPLAAWEGHTLTLAHCSVPRMAVPGSAMTACVLEAARSNSMDRHGARRPRMVTVAHRSTSNGQPRLPLPAREASEAHHGSGMSHEDLVGALRAVHGLVDVGRDPPNFQFRSRPFLHFHEHPEGTYADVRFGHGDFEPVWASTPRERLELLTRVCDHVERLERSRKSGVRASGRPRIR